MRKSIRKWVKDEKRIVRLLYRKGLLTDKLKGYKLKDLYWAEYRASGRRYRSGKYKFSEYLPEVHFCTTDYWGESDEHSVVDSETEGFYWNNLLPDEEISDEYPKSSFKFKGRVWFIKYLSKLKTVRNDSKINAVLIRNDGD
jgi:hypothetical protein